MKEIIRKMLSSDAPYTEEFNYKRVIVLKEVTKHYRTKCSCGHMNYFDDDEAQEEFLLYATYHSNSKTRAIVSEDTFFEMMGEFCFEEDIIINDYSEKEDWSYYDTLWVEKIVEEQRYDISDVIDIIQPDIYDIWETKDSDEECMLCQMMREKNPVPRKICMAHGVSAFNSVKTMKEMLNRITFMEEHESIEICGTNTESKLGPLGIILDNIPRAGFCFDMWSKTDENGYRYSNHFDGYNDIIDISNRKNEVADGGHAEYFCNPTGIIAVWCKKWYWHKLSSREKSKLYRYCTVHKYYLQLCDKGDDTPVPGYEEDWY